MYPNVIKDGNFDEVEKESIEKDILVVPYFRNIGRISLINRFNLSLNHEIIILYQEQGVDVIVYDKIKNCIYFIDNKHDTHWDSQNLFVEKYSNKYLEIKGWLYNINAKTTHIYWFFWYGYKVTTVWCTPFIQFKEWMLYHEHDYLLTDSKKGERTSLGWLVPIRDLIKAGIIVNITDEFTQIMPCIVDRIKSRDQHNIIM